MLLSKRVWQSFAPLLHKDPGIQGRRRSHPPDGAETWVLYGSRSTCLGGFTNAVCAPSLASMAKLRTKRRSPQESQLAQHRVHLASGAAALATRMEDIRMPKAVFFSELQKGKRDRGAPRKQYKVQLKKQPAQSGINH